MDNHGAEDDYSQVVSRYNTLFWVSVEYTSSVGSHSRSAGEIVLFQALAFNDLLSDHISGPEQNLSPIYSRQPGSVEGRRYVLFTPVVMLWVNSGLAARRA